MQILLSFLLVYGGIALYFILLHFGIYRQYPVETYLMMLLGVLAALVVVVRRRKINNEIWLPVEVRFTGSARLLLLKGMNVDFTGQYSDLFKFTVETQI